MKKIICLVVLLMVCALINACVPNTEATLTIDVLHEGHNRNLNGNFTSRVSWVFHSQDDYDNALTTYTDEYSETLDFSEGRVLLVDMGLRNTGGYSINVTSVARV